MVSGQDHEGPCAVSAMPMRSDAPGEASTEQESVCACAPDIALLEMLTWQRGGNFSGRGDWEFSCVGRTGKRDCSCLDRKWLKFGQSFLTMENEKKQSHFSAAVLTFQSLREEGWETSGCQPPFCFLEALHGLWVMFRFRSLRVLCDADYI